MHHVPHQPDFHDLSRTAHQVRRWAYWDYLDSRDPRQPSAVPAEPKPGKPVLDIKPLSFDERSANALRPATFEQMVGQERLKGMLRRIVATSRTSGRPLGHIMLAGQSGTGKTTLAQVTAHESGHRVFQVKAPVSLEVLALLREKCSDGDVVIVDEIHQQVTGDRRGVTQAADPEDFYHVMEDRRLPLATGMVPFPEVTFIGCTTDIGLLPEAFVNRFPLHLTLDPYSYTEMATLAMANAHQLRLGISDEAAFMLGRASRRNPRQVNTYVRNAEALGATAIDVRAAREVIVDLNGNALDGLTPDMLAMLRCLRRSRREYANGAVTYMASVNTIATALGHSRDTKAVSLFVEPYLISEGYVAVTHGGRTLTEMGLQRALEL